MSETTAREDGDALEIEVPADPLAGHPATAYFWGHVAGSGEVSDSAVRSEATTAEGERRCRERIEVVTNDEESAQVLAAVAGGDLEHDTISRDYAHDTSITRTEDEYTLSIGGDGAGSGGDGDPSLLGRSGALGLPVDGRGNYRFGAFSSYDRELLRGLLEGCGTICFKSSSGTVGISFVHDSRELLELTQELIADCPVDAPFDDLSETSSGGYWFGVDDDAAPAFGAWLYETCEKTGCFAPSRRRKLERSLEQAAAYDDEAILLVGHGSRREKSNEQVRKLAADLESRLAIPVDAAFLELAEPSLEEAFAELATVTSRVTVVHCSLFAASHVKNDVPLAIERARAAHDLEIDNGAHLGIHPAILDLLDDRAGAVEDEMAVSRTTDDVAVVLCGRGSSDPDANGDVHKLARLLYEGRAFDRVEATFIGVTEPTLEDTLHGLSKHRPDAVVVLPYMLGDGVLTRRVRARTADFDDDYPYVDALAGDPLGTDSRLLDVLADRWQEARTDSVSMSCDTCKYKVDLEGYEEDVGGARAMLRALAHQEAHADREGVDDDPHGHDAPEKHVAVCTNRTCADMGSSGVLERLRQEARDAEHCDVRITRSSCLGRCGDGPMIAVYPDGIWYGDVAAEDADRIVSDHLERNRIVSGLVDQTL